MSAVTVRAAAKINLHLGVGRPRPDGFHPLVTVFHAVSLYDDVTVTPADDWQVTTHAAGHVDGAALPDAGDNIVDRAAAALARHHARPVTGRVEVHKSIPVAGGMAGGSADAAAALVALDRVWDLGTSDDDLLALAAELGSDVPFSLVGGTALGEGRGELLTPVADDGSWWWVVVRAAGDGLSTPAVYRRYDELRPDASPEPAPAGVPLAALETRDPELLANALHNDLQAAAVDLRPDLADTIATGEAAGALRGLVSGSGPTCVFLARDADHAREVAGELRDGHPTVLVAHGPVAGAHVVTVEAG
ncbi:4-(cytidine 5'-diphospho)-2-C-methyl-D-erythritol kinase [Nocardioides sp.]|uniref:4-(cytidine 5'-diphospho)-2-C-methyl-D-erythritol kinase n=1 Tax=Nocardioides sp. TaxID=35761 RepID=UPI00352875B8